MASQKLKFYRGIILNPLSDRKCDFYADGILVQNGTKIKDVLSFPKAERKYGKEMSKASVVEVKNSVIMPGFFDMHFHWVQDDVRQMPKDSLLEWLEKFTFPTEMKFANKAYAKKRALEFFKKLSSTGTLGGACYSSIHEHAIDAAMKNVKGEFVIGNVIMNMNSPKELTQGEDESLELTKNLIKKYGKRHSFTPRFAITTTPYVMKKGSKMADKAGCFKQTHLSETPGEIDFVLSIYKKLPGFEKVSSYTEIYEKTGMLGKKSLMGHGIHLSSQELKVLHKTKTSIIHCPTSNAPIQERGLGSGLFDFNKTEKEKVSWALGSDIGGGPFLSMFDVMRSFVEQNSKAKIKGATFTKALYRSTLAGAEILGLAKQAGNFVKGKDANFIVVPYKGKAAINAEEVLSQLVLPHTSKRQNYDTLPTLVTYQGKSLFKRPTSPK
jgi:guanine deaminase